MRVSIDSVKSHVMCEFSVLNEQISSLSENFEKAVDDMKGQNGNIDLLHDNLMILQNELA